MGFAYNIKSRLPQCSCIAAFLLTLATSASAAPGPLSEVPLYSRGSAEPNIMLLVDSSISMRELVLPPGGYDETATYADCARPLPGNREVNYRVDRSNGEVEFNIGDGWSTWDTNDNCFNNRQNYRAWLYADDESRSGNSNYYETSNDDNRHRSSVSGHLLNWYFSQQNAGGNYEAARFLDDKGDARRSKVDIRRSEIAKTAATDLVSGLEGARVGLMQFQGIGGNGTNGTGAHALYGLGSVTENSKASLLDAISGITADTSTPLAESFDDVGRYFITGYEDENLSYMDEGGNTVTVPGNAIFAGQPVWGDVARPGNTTESAAIQYYCQKSFMVVLTDGLPTEDDRISDHLKGYDYTCGKDAHACTNENDNYHEVDWSRPRRNHEMDDVIKALYDIDLRPDLKKPDQTPVKNNITSYIIGFAENGVSDHQLMKNAGTLGGGGGVYSADDASQLKVAFNQIMGNVNSIVGSSSAVAFNSSALEQGSQLFAARFDSDKWSGDLSAYTIDTDGNISSTPSWSASAKLDTVTPADRVILTSRKGAGVAFTDALINGGDNAHENDLKINTSSGDAATDDLAAARIDYLRGDRTKEGNGTEKFRTRGGRLGDIVNSSPVYVGAPNAAWSRADFPEASRYAAFKSDNSERTPVVYVGANDGFLHGFSASGDSAGTELIAYAPAALLSTRQHYGLHALSSQTYSHKYYVDGTPTVSDAYINGAWKSVLVGALGGGGKGYFALDVTDPSKFRQENAASLVLWEFTDSDNDNLGYSFSRPQIGRLSNGENGEWVAIFGNGYHSANGDAGLFIRYLDGNDGSGNSYKYISTGVGSENDKNGLSTPAIVDANRDGTIDRIYAGDLKGNLWAFDVSGDSPVAWGVAYSETAGEGDEATSVARPLFSAGTGEPITAAPLVARNTANIGGEAPNLLVAFGTGQYLTEADTSNSTAGGFYAVSDNGGSGLTKSDLQQRTIDTSDVEQPGGSFVRYRVIKEEDAIDWSDKSGWYMQLKPGNTPVGQDGGERVVTRPNLLRNVLFFNTMVPTGQVCSAGGYGWLMSVDLRTGLAPAKHGVFDGNGDGEIDMADQGLVGRPVEGGAPNGSGFIGGRKQVTSVSDGSWRDDDIHVGGGGREGRLAWEEITPD